MSERSLREYIALSLFFGLSMQKRAKGNIMLLLTNCEVHTGNTWTEVLNYGPNEVRSVGKAEIRIFPRMDPTN